MAAPELGVGPGITPRQAISKPWPEPLSAPLLAGGLRSLRSCDDLLQVQKGVDADRLGDRQAQLLLVQSARCQALVALRDRPAAQRSFVQGWRPDAAGWRTAPPALVFESSPDGDEEMRQATRRGQSAADLEKPSFTARDAFHSEARGDGWSGEFTVLVRGLDVTGDGVEDLIVTRNVAATEGTLRSLTYMVLTRTKPSGPLTVVSGFPKSAIGLWPGK